MNSLVAQPPSAVPDFTGGAPVPHVFRIDLRRRKMWNSRSSPRCGRRMIFDGAGPPGARQCCATRPAQRRRQRRWLKRKEPKRMSYAKLMSCAMFLACVFLVAVAVASPAATDQPLAGSSNMQTSLQPDLTLKSTVPADHLPTLTANRKGPCRCSCGYPCTTDAQCGPGGLCEPFISCCDREGTEHAFHQIGARSTRTGEDQALAVNPKCR